MLIILLIIIPPKKVYERDKLVYEKYDLCVSRAVANLSTLSEYCLPYVKVGGKFISYKSEKMEEEMSAARNAIQLLGGKFDKCEEFYRNLISIVIW